MPFTVQKSEAIVLLESLGCPTAAKWKLEKMTGFLNEIKEALSDNQRIDDDNAERTLVEIVTAIEAGEKIEVVEDLEPEAGKEAEADDPEAKPEPEAEKAAEPQKKKRGRPKGKKNKPKEERPAAEKKTAKPKTQKPKKVGVIASIQEFLNEATEKAPISVDDLVERLTGRFPDREPDSMRNTVKVQIPGRLSKEKNVKIGKSEEGYWIEK